MRVNLPITTDEYVLPEGEVIVTRTDLKGRITYANDAFLRSCDFTREELLGKAHNIVRHPDMPPAAFADLWDTIKQGKPWSALVKNRRKHGGFYWVRANVSPIVENGKMVGFTSVRTKPAAEEVAAAAALYQRIREGKARKIMIRGGEVVHKGLRGFIARLWKLPFTLRCWFAASGFAALFAVSAALVSTLPGKLALATAIVNADGHSRRHHLRRLGKQADRKARQRCRRHCKQRGCRKRGLALSEPWGPRADAPVSHARPDEREADRRPA
jgi:aerotaxis receptor